MNIIVSPENKTLLAKDGVLYSYDKSTLYLYPSKKIGVDFTIPDSVTTIAKDAFTNVLFLKNLNITSNIETIEEKFSGCKLTSINNIKTREEYLNWDSSIKSVFQNNLTAFEGQPFSISLVEQEVQYTVDNYIEEGMNDFKKLKALYNYVANKVEYTTGNRKEEEYHSISSIFLGDETVCEGYALGMSLLLDKVGIKNYPVLGGGKLHERHAWLIVQISGVWLQIDPTWDDVGDYAGTSYFLKTTDEYAQRSHESYDSSIGSISTVKNFTQYSFGISKFIDPCDLPECGAFVGDLNKNGVLDQSDVHIIADEIQAYNRW